MKRHESQITLRARTLSHGVSPGGTRLTGKVVLIDASDVEGGVQRAYRYAKEGADVALAYREPTEPVFIVQRQIEALGNRCVLYEIDLDDEWNCGLVAQSTAECLGPIDLIVNRRGHVHVCERECTAADVLGAVMGQPVVKTSTAA